MTVLRLVSRAASLWLLATASVSSFSPRLQTAVSRTTRSSPSSSSSSIATRLFEQRESQSTNESDVQPSEFTVNGATAPGFAGGLVQMGSALQSQLVSAFSALDETDQYDAVLTGLCAKVLDAPSMKEEQVAEALKDPIQLLEEMNSRRIRASDRSLMALVDATVTAQDAKLMAKVMALAKTNGGISQYGNFQASVMPLPTLRTSKVRCPDGVTRTRAERLESLPDVPADDRATEVAYALVVANVIGFCGTVNILGLDDISAFTNIVWFSLVTVGLLDNFFDLFKTSMKTFASDQAEKIPESLPFSLGSGQITGTIVKGFNRLFQVDTERECECEAAAFFAAYALGLPCFAFRPNALEAAVLVAESESNADGSLDPLLSNNGIMKMLVWLMAPVAMENMKHSQLVVSDPREGPGLLTRLETSANVNQDQLWWMFEGEEEERKDMIQWAFTEADLLLRSNQKLVSEISKRLIGGSATVGDCVAAVENW